VCGCEIKDGARHCRRHAQRMRRKVEGQVKRLLALRDARRNEVR